MAFVAMQDEEEKDTEGQAAGEAAPNTLSPSGSAPLSGGTGTAGSALGRTQGPFVNLNQYLDANQSKIEPYAQKLTGSVNKSVDEAKGTIDSNEQQFLGDVSRGTARLNPALAGSSLTDIARDDALKKDFIGARDAQYRGPAAFSGAQQASVNQAVGTARNRVGNLLDQQGGLQSEVRQVSRNPTAGKTAFNATLVGGSQAAKDIFGQNRDAQRTALDERLAKLAADKQQAVNVARETTDQSRKAIQERLASDRAALEAQRDEAVRRANKEREAALARARESVTDPSFDPDLRVSRGPVKNRSEAQDAENLGLTLEQLRTLRRNQNAAEMYRWRAQNDLKNIRSALDSMATGDPMRDGMNFDRVGLEWQAQQIEQALQKAAFDPTTYFNVSANDITAENAASPELFAQVAALNELSGADSGILNTNASEQALGFNRLPVRMDYNRALADLARFIDMYRTPSDELRAPRASRSTSGRDYDGRAVAGVRS